MELLNCPCCGGEMRIVETRMPDFTLEHKEVIKHERDCRVCGGCVDNSFRAFTIDELIKNWNKFCESEYDESKPGKIPIFNIGKKYCPIAKTICEDGLIFNGIECAFTTDYGGCIADTVQEWLNYLTTNVVYKGKSIPIDITSGEILTYEQN